MEQVRRAYGTMADQYIDLVARDAPVTAEELALITRRLTIRSGAVLDAGCGPGHLTAHLRSQGVDAIGIDLVPEFIDHARATHPDGRYVLGSMDQLPVRDGSLAGILSWYSLIHLPPDDLDGVLAELRRATTAGGTVVAGFFTGDELADFEHKVVTAYFWPVDELSARLRRAGFTEVERQRRPGTTERGYRPHAAIAAIAT